MDKRRYLFNNALILAIGNLGTKSVSFFLVPLYTHVLNTSEYGIVDLIFNIIILITPFIMFNICEAVMRFSLDENADHSAILSNSIVAIFIGNLIALLSIPIVHAFNGISEYTFLIYLLIVVSSMYPIPLSFLRGMEKFKVFAFCNILNAFLVAIFNIIFLLVYNMGIRGYILSTILANSVVIITSIVVSKMYLYVKHFHFDKKLFIKMFKYSIALVPDSISWWITNSSDRLIITAVLGTDANGIYAISGKLPSLMFTVYGVFTQAWQISAIKEFKSDDNEHFNNYIYNILFKFIFIFGSLFLLVLQPLMKLYVNSSYFNAWRYSPFLLFAFMVGVVSSFLGANYSAAKNNIGNMLSTIIGAVINIIGNILLIPYIGINGASFSTFVSYLAIFIYRALDTRKYVKINTFSKVFIFNFILFAIQIYASYIDNYIGRCICLLSLSLIIYLDRDVIFKSIKLIKKVIKKGVGEN